MTQGNFEKARLEFRNALQIDPNNAELRFQAGMAAEKTGNLARSNSDVSGSHRG